MAFILQQLFSRYKTTKKFCPLYIIKLSVSGFTQTISKVEFENQEFHKVEITLKTCGAKNF